MYVSSYSYHCHYPCCHYCYASCCDPPFSFLISFLPISYLAVDVVDVVIVIIQVIVVIIVMILAILGRTMLIPAILTVLTITLALILLFTLVFCICFFFFFRTALTRPFVISLDLSQSGIGALWETTHLQTTLLQWSQNFDLDQYPCLTFPCPCPEVFHQ